MNKTKIAILLGTTREGSRSGIYANLVRNIGESRDDVEVLFVDPTKISFPLDGKNKEPTEYTNITAEAQAFFVITPEYNHSYAPTVKRMLDSEYDNYNKKPVVLAGVSNGQFGGARAIEALLTVVHHIGMVPLQTELLNPFINDLINEDQTITNEQTIERINKAYDELIWFAQAFASKS